VKGMAKAARVEQSCESTFSSESAALRDCRLVAGSSGSRVEVKTTVAASDVALPSAKYDLRFQAAVERDVSWLTEEARSALAKASWPWTRQRHKQRTSRVWRYWRLDETVVTVGTYAGLSTEQAEAVGREKPASGTVSYEVELELLPGAGGDDEQICRELLRLLVALNPIEAVDTRPDPAVALPPDDAERAAKQLRDSLRDSSKRFPGSMPIGMCRRHLPDAQRPEQYAVAEKSDGERRLLVVFQDGADRKRAALVDRGAEPPKLVALARLDKLPVGTVLDGEVVHNLALRVPVFLVFDVLHDGAADVTRRSFDARFFETLAPGGPLAAALAVPCPSLDEEETPAETHSHLFAQAVAAAPDHVCLVPKRFVRPRDVARKVLARIRTDHDADGQVSFGSRVFRDDAARCHLTDGLVFVPRPTEYRAGTDPNLLKWKWPDGLTVDLSVSGGGKGADLSPFAVADDGDLVDCSKHVVLAPHDQARLRADVHFYADLADAAADAPRSQPAALVAELGLDPNTGLWLYHGPRPDKTAPNHFDVFVDTILLHAESPDQPELEYRLKAASPEADDWHLVLARALKLAASPWREEFSKTHKRPYWYNKDTRETLWTRPPELAP